MRREKSEKRKEEKEKEKIIRWKNRKIKERKRKNKKRRVLWTFHHLIYLTQPKEAVLSNVSSKRFQIHQRIRFTNTATAEAATATAEAVPNTALLILNFHVTV
jgi:hypothetical protein